MKIICDSKEQLTKMKYFLESNFCPSMMGLVDWEGCDSSDQTAYKAYSDIECTETCWRNAGIEFEVKHEQSGIEESCEGAEES